MYINNQVKFKFYYFFSTNLRGIFCVYAGF